MSNVTVLSGNLPSFLIQAAAEKSNKEFASGISNGARAPRISIDGKVWRVIEDGSSRDVTEVDQDGQQVPVRDLKVVILAANTGKYKQFFGQKDATGTITGVAKYDPKGDASAPTCYSYDGVRPSENSDVMQSATCAACRWNVWGSAITDQGSESRACSDNKLLAVIAASDVAAGRGLVYQFKVPPSALSRSKESRKEDPANATSLAEYIELLNRYVTADGGRVEVPAYGVVTKLFFDIKAPYPLPRFKFVRFLSAEEFAYVQSRRGGDDVKLVTTEEVVDVPALPTPAPVAQLPAHLIPAAPQQEGVPAPLTSPNTFMQGATSSSAGEGVAPSMQDVAKQAVAETVAEVQKQKRTRSKPVAKTSAVDAIADAAAQQTVNAVQGKPETEAEKETRLKAEKRAELLRQMAELDEPAPKPVQPVANVLPPTPTPPPAPTAPVGEFTQGATAIDSSLSNQLDDLLGSVLKSVKR